jgi:hypothetical protein
MAFHNAAANEWLGFRLEMIGATVLCTSALFLVILPENVIKPGSFLYLIPVKKALEIQSN